MGKYVYLHNYKIVWCNIYMGTYQVNFKGLKIKIFYSQVCDFKKKKYLFISYKYIC